MIFPDGLGGILEGEPLARHTSFRTGGPARYFASPDSEEQLLALLRFARRHSLPFVLIGRGSNLLVSDQGFDGLVVKMACSSVTPEKDGVRAGAGISLAQLYEEALALGFTGLEFAAGIPGSLGGATLMNAGAYGGEMKDVVRSVRWLDPGGVLHETPAAELGFGYRRSSFPEGACILSVHLGLPQGNISESRRLQSDLMERRRASQPLDLPSAGSTFKRPPGFFAGPLIEMSGLRGASSGGAAVSRKHAGFVVNTGCATSADIFHLISEVQRTVHQQTGIWLDPEIRFLGVFEQ